MNRLTRNQIVEITKKNKAKEYKKTVKKLYKYALSLIKYSAKKGETNTYFWFKGFEKEALPEVSEMLKADGFTTKMDTSCFHISWEE